MTGIEIQDHRYQVATVYLGQGVEATYSTQDGLVHLRSVPFQEEGDRPAGKTQGEMIPNAASDGLFFTFGRPSTPTGNPVALDSDQVNRLVEFLLAVQEMDG